ncbi:MAG: DUF72 domain-containing protein [Kiloniellaceae bacterium]
MTAAVARHWVGTSGWSYANWRGLFYPPGLKQREWIGHYAAHLRSVEVNATFYRLPQEKMLSGWAERTPADFLFAVKAWRAISHYKRLGDCEEALKIFLGRIWPLRPKCGPILVQLPPRFARDAARLAAFLALLPEDRRFAFEFRDPSWHDEEVYALLARRNAAFCPFELAGLSAPRVATADFVYVRLHGRKARYRGAYDEAALAEWAGWLAEQMAAGRDVYVYFDNTDEADHAVRDAIRLDRMLRAAAD